MRGGIVSIGIASAVIATALLVLVYRGGVAGPEPAWVGWLPFVNAFFNSVSARRDRARVRGDPPRPPGRPPALDVHGAGRVERLPRVCT